MRAQLKLIQLVNEAAGAVEASVRWWKRTNRAECQQRLQSRDGSGIKRLAQSQYKHRLLLGVRDTEAEHLLQPPHDHANIRLPLSPRRTDVLLALRVSQGSAQARRPNEEGAHKLQAHELVGNARKVFRQVLPQRRQIKLADAERRVRVAPRLERFGEPEADVWSACAVLRRALRVEEKGDVTVVEREGEFEQVCVGAI